MVTRRSSDSFHVDEVRKKVGEKIHRFANLVKFHGFYALIPKAQGPPGKTQEFYHCTNSI